MAKARTQPSPEDLHENDQAQEAPAAPVRRRRRWPIAAAVIGAAAVAGGGWYASSMYSPLPISAIAVTGASSDLEQQVLAATAVSPGQAFSEVDPGRVAAAVESIEGIESAQVGWAWWNTLSVSVVEQVPAAVIAAPDGLTVIDAEGQPIRQVAERPPSLLLVEAPDEESLRSGLGVAAAVPQPWVAQAEAVVVTDPRDVQLRLVDSTVVVLGNPVKVAEKLAIAEKLRGSGAMVINVSVPERPALAELPAGQP